MTNTFAFSRYLVVNSRRTDNLQLGKKRRKLIEFQNFALKDRRLTTIRFPPRLYHIKQVKYPHNYSIFQTTSVLRNKNIPSGQRKNEPIFSDHTCYDLYKNTHCRYMAQISDECSTDRYIYSVRVPCGILKETEEYTKQVASIHYIHLDILNCCDNIINVVFILNVYRQSDLILQIQPFKETTQTDRYQVCAGQATPLNDPLLVRRTLLAVTLHGRYLLFDYPLLPAN